MAETRQVTPAVEPGDTEEMVLRITADKGGREIAINRVLDARRESVWRAMTDPTLLQRWWGPKDLQTTIEKFEARPGGIWRILQRDGAGKEYGFHGVFHDIEPMERIVQTFEYEGAPGHVSLQTTTLEGRNGKTVVDTMSVFQSDEDRDAMIAAGMERGVRESIERLLDLLDELEESD